MPIGPGLRDPGQGRRRPLSAAGQVPAGGDGYHRKGGVPDRGERLYGR